MQFVTVQITKKTNIQFQSGWATNRILACSLNTAIAICPQFTSDKLPGTVWCQWVPADLSSSTSHGAQHYTPHIVPLPPETTFSQSDHLII